MESTVGFFGIIKLTTQIILQNLKHFLCIALILALPSAVSILLDLPSGSIHSLMVSIHVLFSKGLPGSDDSTFVEQKQPPAFSIIALSIFSIAIFLICRPVLAFSVCRACMKKSVEMKGCAKGIGRSVGKLVVTWVCEMGLIVGVGAVVMVVIAVITAVVGSGGAVLVVIMIVMIVVYTGTMVYLAVGLSLAWTVAILEEARGWEAMRRSMYLVGQGKGLTLALLLLFALGNLLVFPLLASHSWIVAGVVGLSLQALISLFSEVALVVLYMSLLSRLQEPLDALIAASSQFDPLDAKYLDLETATSVTATSA